MYLPTTYFGALFFMICSMLCWGSWANTTKLASRYPFQIFYWDYCLGMLLMSLFWGFTLGSMGSLPTAFLSSLTNADVEHVAWAIAAGVIFNAANLLLVAAIEMVGMAVAFPVGIGIALVLGVLLSYVFSPSGQPVLLFGGLILIVAAIGVDAKALSLRGGVEKLVTRRGLQISICAGVLMGLFFPLVIRAMRGEHALGPYSVTLVFAIGVGLCALFLNTWFMKHPITGEPPVIFARFSSATAKEHLLGLVGGAVWCSGAVLSFAAAEAHKIGPAVSYAIGQGATMVSALWGVLVWKEFSGASSSSKQLLPWMFLLFTLGLAAVAIAPLYSR